MTLSYTHGREFLRDVRPILERRDPEILSCYLSQHWSNGHLRGLLACGHDGAVRAALLCLALTGTMADNAAVARLLHDDDAQTVDLAERALWFIWLRSGDDQANRCLTRAIHLIDQNQLDQALALLNDIARRCPTFAEAHNQRAIVHFLKGDYVRAIGSSRQALRLNPHHFGAAAGLGHSFAALGYLHHALEAYHRSLALHPRLEGIRQSIQQVRRCMGRSPAPSNSQPTLS